MRKTLFILSGILQVVLLSFFFQSNVNADTMDEKRPHRVPRVNGDITVDAYLNESIWQEAVKIHANIEVRPAENVPAPVKTEVLLAYNASRIFVAFIAYDPEPHKIQAHYCDRDKLWDDDWVIILFDTFNDQRRTYDFGCNPLGIQCDFIESPTGGGDEWDAIWDSHGRINDEGYIVEMAIPFSSLSFPRTKGDQIWGFDAVRSYPRIVRHHIGAFPRDRSNNCYMCQAEKLIGFAGCSPGKNLEFDPTLSAILSQERQDKTAGPFIDREKRMEPGLTTSWGVTPNLTLNTTINPDFSNVEADIFQLDINNQFALDYPEKRPFFLEGADFFQTPLRIVHTRSLADPDWGVKLTGKEGKAGIGFYTAQDQITNFLIPGAEGSDSESLDKKSYGSAFRYQHDLFKSSNIGIILTDREGADYYNRLTGVNADLKFTQKDRFIFQVLTSSTQYPDSIRSHFDQPDEPFNGQAYAFSYEHDTRDYTFFSEYRKIDNLFRADMGFISQVGYQIAEVGAQYKWQKPPGHWYNDMRLLSSYTYEEDFRGDKLHNAWQVRVNYEGPLRSHSHWLGETGRKSYNGQNFRMNWMQGCFGLYALPSLFIHLYWRYGDGIDYANTRQGTRLQLEPYTEFNIGMHLKVSINHIFEKMDITHDRLYTANVSSLNLVYQFNRRTFLRLITQFIDYDRNTLLYEDEDVDSHEKFLFNQILFSYKINPQTVFFLGYSDNHYSNHLISLTQSNRTLFAKIGYAYRL